MQDCPQSPHPKFTEAQGNWLRQLRWFPSTGSGLFQDTSWLELMWFFSYSTGVSIPVLVEGKYAIRGESPDCVLVEPTWCNY